MSRPAQVFSLAETIGDEMLARGWTTDDVAELYADSPENVPMAALEIALLISVPTGPHFSEEALRRLARAFDVSWEFFANIAAGWDRWPDARSPYKAPDALFGPLVRTALSKAPS